MNWVIRFAKSSIGAKMIMAVTGVALILFLFAHMSGNLIVFRGPVAYNNYAAFLKSLGGLLWVARLGLLAAVVLHIASSLRLAMLNRAARPVAYANKRYVKASLSSRTMVLSGLTVFAFIAYHLAHFTFGVTHPEHFRQAYMSTPPDVYSMFIAGFREPAVAIWYIIALILLGVHVSHGATSMFRSLGLTHPRYQRLINCVGPVLALIFVVGNCSMPVAVLLGFVG